MAEYLRNSVFENSCNLNLQHFKKPVAWPHYLKTGTLYDHYWSEKVGSSIYEISNYLTK